MFSFAVMNLVDFLGKILLLLIMGFCFVVFLSVQVIGLKMGGHMWH